MERGINPKPERKRKQTNLVIFQISDNGRGVKEKEETKRLVNTVFDHRDCGFRERCWRRLANDLDLLQKFVCRCSSGKAIRELSDALQGRASE